MTATERSARRRRQEQDKRAEIERLRAEVADLRAALGEPWCRAYERAFFDCALERGWDMERAEAEAVEYSDRAYKRAGHRAAAEVARDDVLLAEQEGER